MIGAKRERLQSAPSAEDLNTFRDCGRLLLAGTILISAALAKTLRWHQRQGPRQGLEAQAFWTCISA